MRIQKVKIDKINPAAYNPRIDLKPGNTQYEKLKKSINTFGYVEPLVWNSQTGNLVGGHQRLKILLEQNIKEVDVSVVALDPEKEKALNLALNKIRGDWDEEKLGALLDELNKSPNFDVTLTGFDIPEIGEILDQLKEAKEDIFDFEGEVKKIKNPKTKVGNIIALGEHRLLCGDAAKPEDLAKFLGNEKVGLIHTDPPYNVDYGGAISNINQQSSFHKQWDRIHSDNLPQPEYEKWLKGILTNAAAYLASGAAIYIWNGHKQFGPMHVMLTELGFHISCVITWAKPTFTLGYGDYNQQTEFCLYGWKEEGGAHKWYGPNNASTLWQIKRDNTTDYIHPTQKPVAIAHQAIRNSSKRGDIVLDMFLGSGTTLIAAESLKRKCFGIEIDPAYCDGIVKRYVEYVGKEKVSKEVLTQYGLI